MSYRSKVLKAVECRDTETLDALIEESKRVVRYLVGLLYKPDPEVREIGALGIVTASVYYPKHIKDVIERLVWAMNEDATTYAVTIPDSLVLIAQKSPKLLLPVIDELFRLSKDPTLRDGLSQIIHIVGETYPKQVKRKLGETVISAYDDLN